MDHSVARLSAVRACAGYLVNARAEFAIGEGEGGGDAPRLLTPLLYSPRPPLLHPRPLRCQKAQQLTPSRACVSVARKPTLHMDVGF